MSTSIIKVMKGSCKHGYDAFVRLSAAQALRKIMTLIPCMPAIISAITSICVLLSVATGWANSKTTGEQWVWVIKTK